MGKAGRFDTWTGQTDMTDVKMVKTVSVYIWHIFALDGNWLLVK